jgi:hypothetical protein
MVVTAWTMLGAGVVVTAIAAPLLARWIARRSAGAAARGWAAVAAAVAMAAAVAPWGLACAALAWVPELASDWREVVRVQTPSRELIDSLVGAPGDAHCAAVGSPVRHCDDPSDEVCVRQEFLCGFAQFVYRSEYHYLGPHGSYKRASWRHADWWCDSYFSRGDPAAVEGQPLIRVSRDRHFAVFNCPPQPCEPGGTCYGAAQLPPRGPALYLMERAHPLREFAQRGDQPLVRNWPVLVAALLTSATFTLLLIARSGVSQPATNLPPVYRDMPHPAPSPELAQRRLLLATSLLFGAIAAASWFALLRALG